MALDTLLVKDATGANQNLPVHTDESGAITPVHSLDGGISTYRAGKLTATPVATPTAWVRIKGSATKTVRIRKIAVSGIATAAGNTEIIIDKNSTTGTDNASTVWTALTKAPLDSEFDASGATVEVLTGANQDALGTSVGVLAAGRLCVSADGSGVYVAPYVVEFGTGGQSACVLRGTTQNVTIGFNGDAVPSGGKYDVYVEWTEEDETP